MIHPPRKLLIGAGEKQHMGNDIVQSAYMVYLDCLYSSKSIVNNSKASTSLITQSIGNHLPAQFFVMSGSLTLINHAPERLSVNDVTRYQIMYVWTHRG
jgi:hypothetical protein